MWKVPNVFVFMNAALVWSGNLSWSAEGVEPSWLHFFFFPPLFSTWLHFLQSTPLAFHDRIQRTWVHGPFTLTFSLFPLHALSVLPQRHSISALTSCLVYILLQHVTVPAGRENTHRAEQTLRLSSLLTFFLLLCPRKTFCGVNLVTLAICIQETQFRTFSLQSLFIKYK